MANYHKFVKQPASNKEFDFPRGSFLDRGMFELLVTGDIPQVPMEFGRSHKDIVGFTVYSSEDTILAWKSVERKEVYATKDFDFIDYNGDHRHGSISAFDRNYPKSSNGEIIISPTHELKELGYEAGTHKIGVSFRNDILGSEESSAKLVIKNISPSRTEIKLMPMSLKTSKKPLEVSLNFEYRNFFNREILVAHIYNETSKFIKTEGLRNFIERAIGEKLIEGYSTTIEGVLTRFGMDNQNDFAADVQKFHNRIVELFGSVLLWKYNEVFSEKTFRDEYVLCLEYILSTDERFANRQVDTSLDEIYEVYKTALFYQYDIDYVSAIYNAKFNSYFSNILNFSEGRIVPFIKASRGTENINDERKHRPLIIKLVDQLPTDIAVGSKLYISNVSYSDDIIQNAILFKRATQTLYNMRGPNISYTMGGGTKSYTSEDLSSTRTRNSHIAILESGDLENEGVLKKLKELEKEWRSELYETSISITDEISRYFHGSTEEKFLNVDYSDFNKFIRYSSARKRLDVFIYKLAKISEFDRQMEQIRSSWRMSSTDQFDRLSYDSQMEKLKEDKLEVLSGLDGYERFLYFEDITTLSESSVELQVRIDKLIAKIKTEGKSNKLENELTELEDQLLYVYVSWPRAEFECEDVDDWSDTVIDYKPNDAVVFGDSIWLAREGLYPQPEDIPTDVNGNSSDKWQLFCKCGECLGKKVPMTNRDYTFLSARTYYRPAPIPADMEEFSKTIAYSWYVQKATHADFYDKHNDNSIFNNTPEFITRDPDNADYFNFVHFIGHQFDLIQLYVEGIGTIRQPLNNPNKGIPNEMVSHMLNYFGGKFTGFDEGEIDALMTQITSEKHLRFIKEFKDRKHIIWRRILNNLPYILKTVGTEQSVRAMFRCYGVPDYLFRIREYGGVEYNTDLDDEAVYSFDTFDYHLVFDKSTQYLLLPTTIPHDTSSIEFRVGLSEDLIDVADQVEILSSEHGTFGIEWDTLSADKGYGRFYIEVIKRTGTPIRTYIKTTDTKNELVYLFGDKRFDILIRKSKDFENGRHQGIQIYVKRITGSDVVYNAYGELVADTETASRFFNGELVFGNRWASNFFGRLDRVRLYESSLSEKRFTNHILFNQSYDVEDPFKLTSDLIFKANFDYPYKLYSETQEHTFGIIENTAFRTDVPPHMESHNFDKQEYPYNFSGENARHFSKLPSYGAQVFNNNKVRSEKQELISQLSVSSRSTLKTNDRMTADTNTLGIFFSPSDLINHEIIRFFGNFKLGDFIGDPMDLYKGNYPQFEKIRYLFYKHGFGRLDFNTYLNIVESYVDPSLFENIKKLVPARSRLISGLIVEPTLLERPKLKRRPLNNTIISLNDINFNLLPPTKNMITSASSRGYIESQTDNYITGFSANIRTNAFAGKWHPTEFGMNYVKNIPNDMMYGANSHRGISSGYKIEKISPQLKRYSVDHSAIKKLTAIKIYGQISAEAWFDCEFYGDFGIANLHEDRRYVGWIHKETTINGRKPNISDKDFNKMGYAPITYKFMGHHVRGKLYGYFVGQIQSGSVRYLSVIGRIGGKYFDGCADVPLYRGNIEELVERGSLKGTPLRSVGGDKTTTRVSEKTFKLGDINAVKIPETLQKSIPIVFSYDKEFRLENTSLNQTTGTGTYEGELGIAVKAIFKPPSVVTFDIEWTYANNATISPTNEETSEEMLFKIKKSSYDYISNIISDEKIESNLSPENIKLEDNPEYVTYDNRGLTNEAKQIISDLQCSPTYNSRLSTTPGEAQAGEHTTILQKSKRYYEIGDVVARYSYDIPFGFTQKLKTLDGFLTNPKLEVNMVKEMFSVKFTEGDQSREMFISPEEFSVTGDAMVNGYVDWSTYTFDTFYLSLLPPVNLKVGDRIYLTGMKMDYTYCSTGQPHTDFNNKFYTITKVTDNVDAETVDIEFPHGMSILQPYCGGTYMSSGKVFRSKQTYDDVLFEGSGYKLKLSATITKPPEKTAYPVEVDYDVSVGDYVEIMIREGSYLWITRGLKLIEGLVVGIDGDGDGKIAMVRYVEYETNPNSKIESFEYMDEEIPLNSTHVYSVRIIKEGTRIRSESIKKIKFSKKYSEILKGTSEKKLYPTGYFKELPITIEGNLLVRLDTPFEHYNLQDIGLPNSDILVGSLPQHRSNFRNIFSTTPKSISKATKRRSVNSYKTTVSSSGQEDLTPPIVRIRKPAVQGTYGDTFWYLDDIPVVESEESVETEPSISSPELHQHLQLHYVFETEEYETEVLDVSGNERHGDKHSVLVRDGGESRLYRKVLSLDNDIRTNEDNTKSYISVMYSEDNDHIKTDKATISFWIRPTGISEENAGIVFNNSSTTNNRHGIVMNPNGNSFSLGYSWSSNTDSYVVDLNTPLDHDEWNHVVILIYNEGIVRVFVNKWFVRNYDLGVEHEEVTFDNLEIGRFSGMIDDIRFYDDILEYGDMPLNKQAIGPVAELYDSTRQPAQADTPTNKECRLSEFDFKYYQSIEFTEAHKVYKKHPPTEDTLADPEIDSDRKFDRIGGPLSGEPKLATAEFMGNLCGTIKEIA